MSTSNKAVTARPLVGYILGALLIGGGVFLITEGKLLGWAVVACALLFLPFVWNGVRNAIPLRELGAIRGILALGLVVMGALPFIKGIAPESNGDLTRGGGGPPPDLNTLEKAADPAQGRYVALLFAAEGYEHWHPLDRPIDDARALQAILTKQYLFAEADVKLVIDPTRDDIINSLDQLSSTLGENDNLLIYYAGHGAVRKAGKQGSWIPVDGETDKSSSWVSIDDIVGRLSGLSARHVLVIVDACFGGTLLNKIDNTRGGEPDAGAVAQIYNRRSRKAMTSGAAEEVSDASPFMALLRAELGNNKRPTLFATQLFSAVHDSLVNRDYAQAPQFSNIGSLDGNDGGDFVFVRR